jgi:hypothetical protein
MDTRPDCPLAVRETMGILFLGVALFGRPGNRVMASLGRMPSLRRR